jgi:DNA-binding response OmpR family regulator
MHVATHGMEILVIEDDQSLAETYRELFDICGHKYVIATNKDTAVLLLLSFKFDIIIADLPLPDFDCRRFVSSLADNHNNVSKIIVTANKGMRENDRKILYEVGIVPIFKSELPFELFEKNISDIRKIARAQKIIGDYEPY